MNQSTHGGLHCNAAQSSDDQICCLCGNTLQTQDDQPSRICGSALQVQVEDDVLLKEDSHLPQKIQPQPSVTRAVWLLGLIPILLLSSACLIAFGEGRCHPHNVSGPLAVLALFLWVVEFVLGMACLFNRQIRSVAGNFLVILGFSVPFVL